MSRGRERWPSRRRLLRFRPGAAGLAVAVFLGLWLVWLVWLLAWPLPGRLAQPPSALVEYRDGSPAFVFLSPDDRFRMAVEPSGVDPRYLAALLRFEDKRFHRHSGVDLLAVARAAWLNLRQGEVVTGASTLTLQLVRVLEPRPRTLGSKLVEALRAVQLEARLSKEEVLAAYMTFVPFGRNVEGLAAASWSYFGHGPERLTGAEIATLLAVPQSPAARYPTPGNRDRLRRARDEIATWLLERTPALLDEPPPDELVVDESLAGRSRRGERSEEAGPAALSPDQTLRRILAEPVPESLRPLSRDAPHVAFWLRARDPGSLRYETTLDRGVQQLVERQLAEVKPEMAGLGIHNGAAVVIDHRSFEVRGLVGNLDFWDAEHGGQIPGFDVRRSPGSALKPFLYALAIEDGLALPEHLVSDVPVRYGDYEPANYDGDFVGLIRLEEALSLSLNVPFVELLQRLGMDRFLDTLRASGVRGLSEQEGWYGLSAAIGSVEVTPLELAALYAALAEGGEARPLAILRPRAAESGVEPEAGDHGAARRRLFSAGAAHLTRRALERRDRPDFPERRRMSGAPRGIAWKTGTSYGHRDAWAAGSLRGLTAVVWLGNFDRKGAIDLVGAEAAGPVLFDLLEALEDRSGPPALERWPAELQTVEVCARSGYLPGAACPTRRGVLALRQRVPTRRCPYHDHVDVDLDTGLALNPSCRTGRRWETRSVEVYPASLHRWLAREDKELPSPPPLDPACVKRSPSSLAELRVISPPAGRTLLLIPGVDPGDQQVPLQVEAEGARIVSWFVDGRFLGSAPASEALWWTPTAGSHEVLATDGAGGVARSRLEVRAARAAAGDRGREEAGSSPAGAQRRGLAAGPVR
ncbi:MAG TPA: transglycosylase domain-containing protein [Thermoanaerobaculia bacterium]|nr:transglycosylase domain-containing protein [Thermoanaerobaculia bacterium]